MSAVILFMMGNETPPMVLSKKSFGYIATKKP